MKHRIIFFTTLIVFTMAFSLSPLCLNVNAQKSGNRKQTREKQEVQKFVDSFIQSLEETKDLDQVSEKFFVADFKARFGQDCNLSEIKSTICNKLNETERYELNTTVFNFGYLGLMHAFGKVSIEDIDKADEEDVESNEDNDIESVKNLFPPQIIGLIKNSKILNAYLLERKDEEGFGIDFEIKDVEQLREFVNDSKNVVYAQRIFLNDLSLEQKAKHTKNIKLLRKEVNWYQSEICLKDCEGFPEKTRIISYRGYPLYFKIVRENRTLKIFDLYIGSSD